MAIAAARARSGLLPHADTIGAPPGKKAPLSGPTGAPELAESYELERLVNELVTNAVVPVTVAESVSGVCVRVCVCVCARAR